MNKINALILENMFLAERIAKSEKKKIHTSVSYDEIKSAAYFGLTEAAHSYNFACQIPFSIYAFKKIVWSIKTYLRELKWSRKKSNIVSFECLDDLPRSPEQKQIFDFESFDDLQKEIIFLKIRDNLKNREIAKLLKFSESRISQKWSEIKKKLQEQTSNKLLMPAY